MAATVASVLKRLEEEEKRRADSKLRAEIAALKLEAEPTPSKEHLGTFRIAIATTVSPLTRPDDIVVVQRWRTDLIEAAHELGSRVLVYQNCSRAQEPDTYGNYNSGLTLKQAKALKAATTEVDSDEGGYVCLPGTTGYAKAWAEAAISAAKKVGTEGIFLDDMNVSSGQTSSASTWNAGMEAFNAVAGPMIRAAGLLAIPNMSGCVGQYDLETDGWVEKQFAYYDGGYDEFFYVWPGGATVQPQTYIESALGVMARQTAAGKLYLVHVPGTASVSAALAEVLKTPSIGNVRFFTEHEGYGSQDWPKALEEALAG